MIESKKSLRNTSKGTREFMNMQLSPPLISVIIPAYNRSDYLKVAIESVLAQTYKNFELIVSDDCSPEDVSPAIRAFQDNRIRLRRNTKNLGVGLNMTCAAAEAKGKYIASLNDDDKWDKHFLEALVRPLEEDTSLALSFCDYFVVDEAGEINFDLTKERRQRENRHQLKRGVYTYFGEIGLVHQSIFTASAALIRRDAVKWEAVCEADIFWDYYLIYLAFQSGLGAYYCADPLAYYRIHADSIVNSESPQSKIRKGKAGIFCHQRFMADKNLQMHTAYFQREWAHASTNVGIGYLRLSDRTQARSYFHQAQQVDQFNPRTLIALVLSYLPQALARSLAGVRNPNLISKSR